MEEADVDHLDIVGTYKGHHGCYKYRELLSIINDTSFTFNPFL